MIISNSNAYAVTYESEFAYAIGGRDLEPVGESYISSRDADLNKPDVAGEFKRPMWMTIDSSEKLYVYDSKRQDIQVFTLDGTLLHNFGDSYKTLYNIMDITFDPNTNSIYALQYVPMQGYIISAFDVNGNHLFDFESQINKEDYTSNSRNIELTPRIDFLTDKNQIFVTDTKKELVHVFDAKGNFLFDFGNNDDKKIELPKGLAVNQKLERVYVTSVLSNDIHVFDAKGNFLFDFAEKSDGHAQFSRIGSIAIDENHGWVHVADEKEQTISVFDYDGKFLFKFGGTGLEYGTFQFIEDIAVDSESRVYVTDQHRVQVFVIKGIGDNADTGIFEQITSIQNVVDVDKASLTNSILDLEKYSQILPKYVQSSELLGENVMKMKVGLDWITVDVDVRLAESTDMIILEVISDNFKGTKLYVVMSDETNSVHEKTTVTAGIDLQMSWYMKMLMSFVSEDDVKSMLNTSLNSLAEYAKTPKIPEKVNSEEAKFCILGWCF